MRHMHETVQDLVRCDSPRNTDRVCAVLILATELLYNRTFVIIEMFLTHIVYAPPMSSDSLTAAAQPPVGRLIRPVTTYR